MLLLHEHKTSCTLSEKIDFGSLTCVTLDNHASQTKTLRRCVETFEKHNKKCLPKFSAVAETYVRETKNVTVVLAA